MPGFNAAFNAAFNRSFNGLPGGGGGPVGPPTETVTAGLEAVNGAQLTAQLGGFGSEAVWKYINLLNEASGPQYPIVGTSILTGSAGVIPNIAGPLGAGDRGVSATDGDADGQWTGGNGLVDPNGRAFAILFEILFAGLPAANRNVIGHDATNDFHVQYMQTTGRIRLATAGTVGSNTSGEITANHNDGNWHTILAVYIPTVGMRVASDLGISTAGTAPAGMTWTGGLYLFRNNNAPAATVSLYNVAYSDGSAAEDAAMLSLYDNQAAAVAAYRTATGR